MSAATSVDVVLAAAQQAWQAKPGWAVQGGQDDEMARGKKHRSVAVTGRSGNQTALANGPGEEGLALHAGGGKGGKGGAEGKLPLPGESAGAAVARTSAKGSGAFDALLLPRCCCCCTAEAATMALLRRGIVALLTTMHCECAMHAGTCCSRGLLLAVCWLATNATAWRWAVDVRCCIARL